MWKKAKIQDLHVGMLVIQYIGDKLPLIITDITNDNIIVKYKCDLGGFGLIFPINRLGSEFYTLYFDDKQLTLFNN